MEPKRILVLDDEWSVLELLKIKLSKHGYEVSTARNSADFKAMALKSPPDLLILDIWLGNQGRGTQVYEDVLRAGFDSSIPVIFISALIEEGTPPKHAPKGGRFAMYGKPFNFKVMLGEIEELLTRKDADGKGRVEEKPLRRASGRENSGGRNRRVGNG